MLNPLEHSGIDRSIYIVAAMRKMLMAFAEPHRLELEEALTGLAWRLR
jgi:hypothetical protein